MSEPSHTAGDPRRSAWVSAHAGSGKTYTLANRVTRLLLDDVPPGRILCLTYTKTAAAEMQHRLFEQLGHWSMLDDAGLAAAIGAIGGAVSDAEGLNKARRLFALALETPGGLKIQTIHAFCQTLLSRFPLEAGVPAGFDVLDDQTSRDWIGEARNAVLTRAGSGDETLAAAAAYLVTQTSEDRLEGILEAALGGDRTRLEQLFAAHDGDQARLFAHIRAAHGAGARDTYEAIASAFCVAAQDGQLDAIIAWLAQGGKTDAGRSAALAQAQVLDTAALRFEALCAVLLTKDGTVRQALAAKALVTHAPHLASAIERLAAAAQAAQTQSRALRASLIAEAALTLASAVHADYTALKRARGALDYNDLIAATRGLLTRGDAAAWVLYKLDGGLDHILIDEAQDTSPDQWDIVKALSAEFFAGQGARGGIPRTIFAVGDEKQSIFSFQGADPLQFDVHRRHFSALTSARDETALADVQLITSRRSAPEILAFVDAVFADEAARDGLSSSPGPITHLAHRAAAKGRIELWPAVAPGEAEEHDAWAPLDAPGEDSPVARLAQRVADAITQWTDGHHRLPGKDRPVQPGDILILMPRREPFASQIIRALKDRGIPVAGADRMILTRQIAVMDLIALGRFVLLPEDELNLAALLRSPLCGLSEDALYALCQPRRAGLWQELAGRAGETPAFAAAHDFLAQMRARADFTPPYEFYAHALTGHGMKRRFVAQLGADAADGIEEFLSLALSFEQHNSASLQGFLHWLTQGETQIKRDMEKARNEVRVMTVHGAKGLEADIVILPDTTGLPQPPGRRGELLYTDDAVFYPLSGTQAPPAVKAAKVAAAAKARQEHRRLLYVALTRAREQLYICGFETKTGIAAGSWYQLCEAAALRLAAPELRGSEIIRAFGEGRFETTVPPAGEAAPPPPRPAWLDPSPAAEILRPRIIRPSQAAEEPAHGPPGGPPRRYARGLIIHALLARLPLLAEGQRQAAAARFLAAKGIAGADAAAIAAEVFAVLSDPAFAAAFAPGARAEIGIAAELPELGEGARIAGRIDRLAVSEAEVLAVDYKTDRTVPAAPEAVGALYLAQMALYRAGLARIFPGRRVACALVWTAGPRLMALPDALLDEAAAKLKARLASA